jgi:hypothetical protein
LRFDIKLAFVKNSDGKEEIMSAFDSQKSKYWTKQYKTKQYRTR